MFAKGPFLHVAGNQVQQPGRPFRFEEPVAARELVHRSMDDRDRPQRRGLKRQARCGENWRHHRVNNFESKNPFFGESVVQS